MKRTVAFITMFFVTAMLTGCIIQKTPSTDHVSLALGDQLTFSVKVFPSATYTWTLDGTTLSNTANSYLYTSAAGDHVLVVNAKHSLGSNDTQVWYIHSNSPPVAHTGPDQTVLEETVVTLDASNSTDPDGDIVSYAWEQIDGPTVTISDASAIKPTFTSPIVPIGGASLRFKVTVTDATGLTGTATTIVNVTWSNKPPTAISGPNQTVSEDMVVILDGSGSTDPDDGITSYVWTQIDGPAVALTNADTSQASFTAPEVSPTGAALTFRLTVTDHGGLKSTATCIVNVTWVNDPPTANAGPDQTVSEVTFVTLDASGSSDTDDGIASYDWQQTEGPAVTLSDASAMKPTFTAPNVTETGAAIKFELTVTDNGGLKSTDICIINVTGVNDPPTSNAGPDKIVLVGAVVTLNGGGSSDPDDGIVSYQWVQTGGPAITLTNDNAAIAHFTASVAPGSILTFELTVTDTGGLQATDICVITLVNGQWYPPTSLLDTVSPNGSSVDEYLDVAMDDNNNALIAWRQYDEAGVFQIFESEKHNGVWAYPATRADHISPNGQIAWYPKIAMDNNENSLIVWNQYDGSYRKIFKSEYRNGLWINPSSLADNISPSWDADTYPQVTMDDNGNAIIVWYQIYNPLQSGSYAIFKSEYRNSVWTHPANSSDYFSIHDGSSAIYPRVAMDNNGNAIIVWLQSLCILKSEYRNGVWTHPTSYSDKLNPSGSMVNFRPQVAMDNNGNAIIVWLQQDESGKYQVFKAEYRNGAWIKPLSISNHISPNDQESYEPQVAMDDNGNAIIVWYQNDGSTSGGKYQIYKSEYRNGIWTHPVSLSDHISPAGSHARMPRVAMDNAGNALIVWYMDYSSYRIYKSEYRGGYWTHPTGLSDYISLLGSTSTYPCVAMNNNGRAIIAWRTYDGTYYRIYKSEFQ